MWLIFKASAFKEVKSESVIKDHGQKMENEINYLISEIDDYKGMIHVVHGAQS